MVNIENKKENRKENKKNKEKKEEKKEKEESPVITENLIKAYALANAIQHDGKARIDAVVSKLFRHGLSREDLPAYMPIIKKIVNKANSIEIKKQQEEFENLKFLLPEKHEKKHEMPELPNVKGKIIMRFAPFPSGPLHLGNARQAIINDYYVKRYNGKLILFMDDTIGSEEKKIVKEAYWLIEDGLKWLGIDYEGPLYKSDRLDIYYEYAEKLIEKGKAYVCFCKPEILRRNREKGIECEHRAYSIEKNLEEWHNMLEGKYKEGEAVLRIKTSMQHKNPAFRDRVLFRISEREHPRVGKSYKVWPLLEMTWAIDDYLLGITHIIRGKELMIETEMEEYIFDIFGWKKPEFIHTGLFSIEGIKLSKSKSQEEIKKGTYIGWDDPRTFSIQSLRRRGFKPEALKEFILSFGLTQTEIKVPLEILYTFNRKYVEQSNRYFFIGNPVKIEIFNAPSLEANIPLHPDFVDRGYRKLNTSNEFLISMQDYKELLDSENGTIFRFMNLFNFEKKDDKFYFHSVEYDKKLKPKMLHWLPPTNNVKARVFMDNGEWINGVAEKNIKELKIGEIVQFERFGFVKLDAIKELDNLDIEGNKEKLYEFWFTHP